MRKEVSWCSAHDFDAVMNGRQSIEIAGRFFFGSTPSNGSLQPPFALDGRDRIGKTTVTGSGGDASFRPRRLTDEWTRRGAGHRG